jgi:hypothetical protein
MMNRHRISHSGKNDEPTPDFPRGKNDEPTPDFPRISRKNDEPTPDFPTPDFPHE